MTLSVKYQNGSSNNDDNDDTAHCAKANTKI